ncbi:hypothetical protein IKG54_00030 [Candidatus Saccharibacteria bacterium]|nr:hypothetical protein [Candidatus Saccharibacteria bacterium]
MKKIFTYFSVMLMMTIGVAVPAYALDAQDGVGGGESTSTSGGGCGDTSAFFSLRPWYYGQTEEINGKCEIKKPDSGDLPKFVWSIVLNILYDVMIMVGYVAIVMIAWGGYLYMFSRGLPDRAERGKKTLIAAVAGLAIAMLASVIMNTIVSILTNVS